MKSAFLSVPLFVVLLATAAPGGIAQVTDTSRHPVYAGTVMRDSAQGQTAPANGPDQALEQYVFPPDLVLRCRERIGLKTEQRDAIRAAMREMQSKTMDTQWKLQDEAEKLTNALKRPSVNEAETLAQVDRVLGAERDVKRAQMTMLIRIKNLLTPEQQESLRLVRNAEKDSRHQPVWQQPVQGCEGGTD